MKTKIFLLVLLFPFVLSCKDSKEDVLVPEEVDIEFEVLSTKGEDVKVSGHIYIQQSLTDGNYYDLKGKFISHLGGGENPSISVFDDLFVGYGYDIFVSTPVRIKKKAKRGVQVVMGVWRKNIEDISMRIYVNGKVVPNMNVIEEYDMREKLIAEYIKIGYTREQAEKILDLAKSEQSGVYAISVPLK